jgi:dihydrofolate synthase/folylpolyglutamate synthase
MRRPIETSSKIDPIFNYPHKKYPIVHVTGTNGKGSTTSMIASILIEAGYKVGTFNTPCIAEERDITKINGIPVPLNKHKQIYNKIYKTARENNIKDIFLSTVRAESAFLYFEENNVDIAVIEADLGAANDSTGIITPIVSLLTNITADHLNLFNNDIIYYAHEKAGVIKNNIPVYIGETPKDEQIKQILIDKANECNSPLTWTDKPENNLIIDYKGEGNYNTIFGDISMCLGGDYQKENLNLVLNAIQELRKQGYNITNENIIEGLQKIYENTRFFGRWHILHKNPKVILDCGHNVDAWEKITKQLSTMKYNKLQVVLQMCKDKDVDTVAKLLPDKENISYWFPIPHAQRLIKPEGLMEKTNWMVKSQRYAGEELLDVVKTLINNANEDDIILICGTCKIINKVITNFRVRVSTL